MLNIAWVAPFIITGGIMWFIVYQMAPIGREFSLGRTILGVVWMALCERGANALLHPHIGDWSILAGFLVSVLVVKFWFDIKFWRAFFAVFLYNAILIASFLLMDYGAKHLPRPNYALQRTRPSRSGCNPRAPRAGSLSLGRWAETIPRSLCFQHSD